MIATLCLSAYVLWTDYSIRGHFEGRRWSLPARVFARPLELHAGSRVTTARLTRELGQLGYRKVASVTGPGQYAAKGSTVDLHTRGFRFLDGAEPAMRVRARFGEAVLLSLEHASGGSVPVLRLEPYELARIYPADREDRLLVRLEEVPPALVDAVLAIEDRNFHSHIGIDFRGIARAVWENLRAGGIEQGGSTITQQLVKNFYLTRERTLWRKLNEAMMAVIVEYRYGKPEILEAYMNEIFLGQDGARAVHGFGLAAEFYFGQPLNELSTAQLALLAGLARGASHYDPRRHPSRAIARRNTVLAAMKSQGRLSAERYVAETAAPLDVTPKPLTTGSRFPAFTQLVRRQLQEDYADADLRTAGLQIFTTLDPYVQERAESAVARAMPQLERQAGAEPGSLQTAMIVAEPSTGEVLAVVGGREAGYAGFNRALDARRPIGSLVKPAVFLAALALPRRYHVSSLIDDAPITLRGADGKPWSPRNYDGETHGKVPLYEALARSYNLATLRLGLDVGLSRVQSALGVLGVTQPVPDYPAVMLGALELTPLETTRIYLTIAADGFRIPPRAIREVLTADGRPLTRYALEVKAGVDRRLAYLLRYMLTRTVSEGTARAIASALPESMPLAGKTGTTNDLRDSWFAGFGGDALAVVWVGRDDNAPARLSGASGAMRLWIELMRDLRPAPLSLTPPEGVEWHWYDVRAQSRTPPRCESARSHPFLADAVPERYAECGSGSMPLARPVAGASLP